MEHRNKRIKLIFTTTTDFTDLTDIYMEPRIERITQIMAAHTLDYYRIMRIIFTTTDLTDLTDIYKQQRARPEGTQEFWRRHAIYN